MKWLKKIQKILRKIISKLHGREEPRVQKVVLGLFALLLGGPEVKMMSRSWVVFAYVVRFPG